jgi:hypothetical protein
VLLGTGRILVVVCTRFWTRARDKGWGRRGLARHGCGGDGRSFGHYGFLEFGMEMDISSVEAAHNTFAVALEPKERLVPDPWSSRGGGEN